jgi:hypothetical protein
LSMSGGGHPHNNIKIAASLTYTQIKEWPNTTIPTI